VRRRSTTSAPRRRTTDRSQVLTRFRDRRAAGDELAGALVAAGYGNDDRDVIVLGLPRGGVPVASRVAQRLGASLDVLLVRKLGVPGHEELAMGAIAAGGIRVLNDDVVAMSRVSDDAVARAVEAQQRVLDERARAYRGERPPLDLTAKTVILVDDGLATGATMRAAVEALRTQAPARVVVAVPVGAPSTCAELRRARGVDDVVCVAMPEAFLAVGYWYDDFRETTDDEVRAALAGPDSGV
jgi:putative phosphoribosyl transferase